MSPASTPRSPRVALVLGAGGSVGHAYHLGVLSALSDELGWDARSAELIIGTSAGSVVGAGLRAGLSAPDMRARALGRPLSPAGRKLVRRGEAAIARVHAEQDSSDEEPVPEGTDLASRVRRLRMASPERVLRALREPWRVTPGSLFSAMIPPGRLSTNHLGAPYDELFGPIWPMQSLWIVAVRLDVGTRVVFGRDDVGDRTAATVGQAVQASCAVPGYFTPVTIGKERFVDGGVHSTTNADLAASLVTERAVHPAAPDPVAPAAPDLVIVSAPMSPERLGTELSPRSAVRQFARRALASEVAVLRDRAVEVVTFQPTINDLERMSGNTMDPAKAPAIVEQANESTRQHLRNPEVADHLAVLSA